MQLRLPDAEGESRIPAGGVWGNPLEVSSGPIQNRRPVGAAKVHADSNLLDVRLRKVSVSLGRLDEYTRIVGVDGPIGNCAAINANPVKPHLPKDCGSCSWDVKAIRVSRVDAKLYPQILDGRQVVLVHPQHPLRIAYVVRAAQGKAVQIGAVEKRFACSYLQ